MAQKSIFGPNFIVLDKMGEGSFAEVFKVRGRYTNELYAIKRLKKRYRSIEEANKLPEILALKALQGHPNIIKLIDVLYDSNHGYLAIVFELLDKNLYELIRDHNEPYDEKTSLVLIYQLLKAIQYMHSKNLFHRDVKPENCMVNKTTFELKLVDFGSTRLRSSRGPFTEYVSTRWYRAPECILTAGSYGPAVDIWAVGCVLYEILTTRPLFPGSHELDQICRIHNILGTPGRDILSQFNQNPNTQINFSFPPRYAQDLQSLMPFTSPVIVDLIKHLLIYNPAERITAEEALNHPAFDNIRREEERWRSSGMNVPLSVFILKIQAPPIRPLRYRPIYNSPKIKPVFQLPSEIYAQKNQNINSNQNVDQDPAKSLNAKIIESRRIAAERIKAYNKKLLEQQRQQQQKNVQLKNKYHPALHLGSTKIVKKSLNPIFAVQPPYQKPKPEIIQPRLPPLPQP